MRTMTKIYFSVMVSGSLFVSVQAWAAEFTQDKKISDDPVKQCQLECKSSKSNESYESCMLDCKKQSKNKSPVMPAPNK